MYPNAELKQLALRKMELRREIAARRVACARAAEHATKPLLWIDRAVALMRRAAPLLPILGAPLALLATRKSAMKTPIIQSMLKWGPLVIQATRYVSSAFPRNTATRPASSLRSATVSR